MKQLTKMIGSLTAKFAALLLAFTCAGSAWGAADTSWYDADQTSFTLTTEVQLRGLAQLVNAGNSFSGKAITLGADIDVGSEEWVTIATSGDNTKFAGTFDGGNHIISNLTIDQSGETPTYRAAGFFGAISGTVKNLKFANANVTGVSLGNNDGATVNGIAVAVGSMAYGGTIDNVSVENATIKGNRYVAGIVGYAKGTVQNCTVKNVTIVAEPDDLTGSYDNGDKCGGIVGYCNGAVAIQNNTIEGNLSITGYRDIGGIVGCGSSETTLTDNKIAPNANVAITVDQVTGDYGSKTPNAGYLAGRVNGATIDSSNTISASATKSINTAVAVAQVGSTKYVDISKAIEAWTSGKTLTLLADVTVAQTVRVDAGRSTAQTLNLNDFTWTTVNCDAFSLYADAHTDGNGSFKVYANASGGVNAGKKVCFNFEKATCGNRPGMYIYGGTYKAATVITNNKTAGPSLWLYSYNGNEPVLDGNINLYRVKTSWYSGTLTGFYIWGFQSTYNTVIYGGKFKTLGMYADSNGKFKYNEDTTAFYNNEGFYVIAKGIPESYEAKVVATGTLSNYSGTYLYYESANTAISKTSSYPVILNSNVVATQDKKISSGTFTIDATAEGAAYNGTVTISGTTDKFVFLGNGDYTVTSGRSYYYVKKVTDGSTSTYSLIKQPAARIGDYYYETLDEAVAAYQKGDTIYVINYQESMTAPEGWLFKAVGDDMTLVMAVAQIGDDGAKFGTVAEAVAAAQPGDTVKLLVDESEDAVVTINNNVTIDLNGKTVTLPGFEVTDGNVEFKNGKVVGSTKASSTFQLDGGNVTLTGLEVVSLRHAVRIEGASVVIDGGSYSVPGTTGLSTHAINIGGSTPLSTLLIKDGTFIGPKGTVSDSGAALNVQNNSKVTVEGGLFKGGKNNTVSFKTNVDNLSIAISGGYFDQPVNAANCADDYQPKSETVQIDNVPYYTVETKGAAKDENGVYYATLGDAVTSTTSGDTITLLKDVTENISSFSRGSSRNTKVLKLNGFTVTGQISVDWQGILDVDGGKVEYPSGTAVTLQSSGTMVMASGEVTGKVGISTVGGSKVTISGGKVSGVNNALVLLAGVALASVSGGEFINTTGTTVINGWQESYNTSEGLALLREEHRWLFTDNIVAKDENDVVYAMLENALTASTSGSQITLLADVTETVTYGKGKTLRLGGKTITGGLTVTSTGILNMSDGKIVNPNGRAVAVNNGGSVIFSGGEITGSSVGLHTEAGATIEITGGTITGMGTSALSLNNSTKGSISGGNYVSTTENTAFNNNYRKYLAEGYVAQVASSTETATTVKVFLAVASVGGQYFETLAAAIDAAKADVPVATISIVNKVVADEQYATLDFATLGAVWAFAGNATDGYTLVPAVASISGTPTKYFATLAEAFAAAADGDTIKLLKSSAGNGIQVLPGRFATDGLTVDFGGFTYTVDGDLTGSAGTQTQAFQLQKNNKITFTSSAEAKGVIYSAKAKMLINNYCDLTLDKMTLTLDNPDYAYGYTLSDNNGNVVINDTTITANPAGAVAFDVCRGGGSGAGDTTTYPSVHVTVTGNSVINGDVELDAKSGLAAQGFGLTLEGGTMNGEIKFTSNGASALENEPEKVVVAKKSTFEQAPPTGYLWSEADANGVQTLAKGAATVTHGETVTTYATLAAAFAAAADGDTVTLLQNVTLTDRLFVNAGTTPTLDSKNRYATTSENKSITLALNGKNITSSSNIALAGGSLNITGEGTISTTASGLAPIEVRGTGDLASKRTLTVGEDVTLTGAEYGLNVFGSNDAQKNVIDVTVDGTVNGTIFVLGNLKNAENVINIVVNGTVDAQTGVGEDVTVGIALNGNANVTVNDGANVTGETGIEVRAGTLTVNGGTITATATEYSYNPNGSGCTTKGAAIAVAQHTTVLGTAVTLNGGTLNGVKTIGVTDVNGNMDNVSVVATQGYTQSSAIPDGYKWVETETAGKYKLTAKDYVAQVFTGETAGQKYESLAEAIAAAKAGDTVQIIKAGDYTLPGLLQNITIEGKVEGVMFSHTSVGNIAAIPNGATFKNVTFNFGNVNYHGFQHAGTITMEGCTLNGKLFSYSDMTFTNCKFNQSDSDYHMWAYSGNLTYNGCTFTNTGTGRFINVYNESGATKYTVTVNSCNFINQGSSSKAALNVKDTCGDKKLAYDVYISNSTTKGAFPAASTSASLIVYSALLQVDDIKTGASNIRVAEAPRAITFNDNGKIIGGTFVVVDDPPFAGDYNLIAEGYVKVPNAQDDKLVDVVPGAVITYVVAHGEVPAQKAVPFTDGKYTLTEADLPTLTVPGYVFTGWDKSAGNEITGPTTITALWQAVAKIGETKYDSLQAALNAAATARADVTVEILDNIDLTGMTWTPVYLNGYDGSAKNIVVNGNNKTITGLTAPLIRQIWSSASIKFKDLTVSTSTIGAATISVGSGSAAFIGGIDSGSGAEFTNCHVVKCAIGTAKYCGAFIGYTSDRNAIALTNCSVERCTITGTGSSGSLIGHTVSANVTITDTTVTDNTITGENAAKTGILIGTDQGTTSLVATESGNTLYGGETQLTGSDVHEVGRVVGGNVTVTEGGSYSVNPTQTSTGTVSTPEDYEVAQKDDGFYTVTAMPAVAKIGDTTYTSLQKALNAAHEMTGDVTVELVADISGYSIVHQKAGLNVTIDGKEKTVAGQIIIDGDGRSTGTETLTIKNIKFEGNTSNFCSKTDAFILVPSTKDTNKPYTTGKYNYAHNVTVADCSFTSTSSSLDVVGYKSTSGASQYNMTIKDSTGSNLHSLAQLTGTTGATITGCKVTGSESFVNVSGGGGDFTISNCEFTSAEGAEGYAVRENSTSTATITLSGNNFVAKTALQIGKGESVTAGTIKVVDGFYNGDLVKTAAATGKFEISGGHFSAEIPQEYCADGLAPANGIYQAETPDTPNGVGTAVAQVGDVQYVTFEEAIDAADAGNVNEITILNGATESPHADWKISDGKLIRKVYVAQIGETKYETFAAALDAVKDGETITVLNVAGNESDLIDFDRKSDIAFTITGTAPNYGLPTVTFADKDASGDKITITIKNATLKTAELDARQNATINVVDSTIKGKGSNDIVKSYFNGAINIGGASQVYTMQLTTTGYITISDNAEVTATWQANVLCNGLLTVAPGATLNTAALQLTGEAYSGRDNTDADRVGKPAALVVDGATLNVGCNAYSSDGADYNYNSSGYGINIGTVDGKSAVLDIKNASTVVLAQNSGNGKYDKKVTFGAGATVNVTGGSTLTVRDRGSNGVTLTNGGTIALDVTSSVVTPGFASTSGSIVIDSTGLTQPVKVIDYTGAGTMAIADYGTVTVKSGETYAEANDLWVKRLDVAQIGTTKYASLAEAILAAQDGDTIEILDGTWGADAVGVFDEPGKYTNAQAVRAKSLTIQAAEGAKPKFTADVKLGYEDSKTANATMTVKGLAFENAKLSLVNYVQATVEDCTFTGSGANAALFVGDSCDKNHLTPGDYPADQVTIKDCTFDGTAAGAAAIRVRNGGNVTVTGNMVANSAHNGILLESNTAFDNTAVKTVTITGNTITEWNAGNVTEGGRGIRASLGGLAEGSTVTVEGNVFRKTTTGLDEPDFAKITGAGGAAVDISGNDWNNMLLSEVKDNGAVYTSDATTTTITFVITTRKEPVAQIGTTKYETLQDANDASQSGDTIELLKDVEIEDRIVLKSGVTLDGKNKTISPANSPHFTPDANHDGYNMFEVSKGVTGVTIKNVTITSYNSAEKREMAPRHLIAVSGQATVQDVTLHQYTVGFVKNASSGKRGADALQTNGDCTIAGALSVAVGTEVWSPISLNNSSAANKVRFADGAKLTITEDLRPEPQQATIRTHGFTTTEVIGADKIGYVAVFGAAKGTTCNQSGYEPADSAKVGNTRRPGTLYNYKATVGADEAYYTTFALAATVVGTTGTVENFKAPAGDDVYALTLANTSLKVIKNGFEPNLTVPEGYELLFTTAEGGVTTYTIGEGVATITTGGVTRYYASLQNAVDAAVADDTVKLIKDATAERTTISKSITVDLGGNTLTGRLTVDDGEVTVQNGTVVGRFDAYDAATVTLDKTATVTGQVVVWGTGTYGETGCKTPTMNVYGTVSNTGDSAITFNGTDMSGAILNIYADATVTSTDHIAIYQPSGNVNVNGGTITGATGIYTKAGALSISGGTISGTGTAAAYTHNGNGANATGDALVVENCGYPNDAPVVSITGGTFRSTNAKAVGSYAKDSTFPALTGFILPTGTALFSDDVSDGVPAGYELVPAGEGYDGLYKLARLTGILYVTGKDANGKNRGVMMDVAWLKANKFIADEVATQEELDGMQAALSESGKNGLPYWQSYVLGVDPNGTYPLTIAKGVSSGENYIITGKFAGGKEGFNTANDTIFRVKPSKNATMTVEFTLVQRGAFDAGANDWTWSEVASATQTASSTNTAPQFTVPMDKVANKVLAISVTIMVDDKK